MLIKAADDKQADLDALAELLTRPDVNDVTRKRIDQEVRTIRAGVKGERDAAYEIDFFCRDRPNWAVLHDLRLEVDGLTAQIDHLLISRLLIFWVCESKHFAEGVAINDHGEWQRYWNGRAQGMASPVEQNRKHIVTLRRLFDSGLVTLPRRLGITLKPDYRSLILVSNEARIARPRRDAKVDGLDTVIKAEQLAQTIDKQLNQANPLILSRLISTADLERLARDLAALHRPSHVDWAARFGLNREPQHATHAPLTHEAPSTATGQAPSATQGAQKQRLVCAVCGERVSYTVARFCWFNKPRFGGRILCMDCQKREPSATPAQSPARSGPR